MATISGNWIHDDGTKEPVTVDYINDDTTVTVNNMGIPVFWNNIDNFKKGNTSITSPYESFPRERFQYVTSAANAYNGCTSMTDYVDSDVLVRGDGMYDRTALTEAYTPSTLVYANNMFNQCKSLTGVTVSHDKSSLMYAYKMFEGCSKLDDYSTPFNSLRNGNNMFNGCSNLNYIHTPIRFADAISYENMFADTNLDFSDFNRNTYGDHFRIATAFSSSTSVNLRYMFKNAFGKGSAPSERKTLFINVLCNAYYYGMFNACGNLNDVHIFTNNDQSWSTLNGAVDIRADGTGSTARSYMYTTGVYRLASGVPNVYIHFNDPFTHAGVDSDKFNLRSLVLNRSAVTNSYPATSYYSDDRFECPCIDVMDNLEGEYSTSGSNFWFTCYNRVNPYESGAYGTTVNIGYKSDANSDWGINGYSMKFHVNFLNWSAPSSSIYVYYPNDSSNLFRGSSSLYWMKGAIFEGTGNYLNSKFRFNNMFDFVQNGYYMYYYQQLESAEISRAPQLTNAAFMFWNAGGPDADLGKVIDGDKAPKLNNAYQMYRYTKVSGTYNFKSMADLKDVNMMFADMPGYYIDAKFNVNFSLCSKLTDFSNLCRGSKGVRDVTFDRMPDINVDNAFANMNCLYSKGSSEWGYSTLNSIRFVDTYPYDMTKMCNNTPSLNFCEVDITKCKAADYAFSGTKVNNLYIYGNAKSGNFNYFAYNSTYYADVARSNITLDSYGNYHNMCDFVHAFEGQYLAYVDCSFANCNLTNAFHNSHANLSAPYYQKMFNIYMNSYSCMNNAFENFNGGSSSSTSYINLQGTLSSYETNKLNAFRGAKYVEIEFATAITSSATRGYFLNALNHMKLYNMNNSCIYLNDRWSSMDSFISAYKSVITLSSFQPTKVDEQEFYIGTSSRNLHVYLY